MEPLYFTSYEIAKLLQVSRQAVNQWIDKKYMDSHRTPGGHRRVHISSLIQFLNQREIPVPGSLQSQYEAWQAEQIAARIVVIDDNQDFMMLLEQAITQKIGRCEVLKFTNGIDALVEIGSKSPDLVILDLRMPQIDGEEVCRRLNANEQTKEIPIILSTAYELSDGIDPYNDLGVQGYHSKSSPISEIIDKATDLLGIDVAVS